MTAAAVAVAEGHELRGTEPRALADLFTLLAAHGIRLQAPDFADRVPHGLPRSRPARTGSWAAPGRSGTAAGDQTARPLMRYCITR
ncbi:hypothetical protein [Streptomyces sp. CoH27]|uniref:hypothetical protein n=1 Tax=Streptomyces sp. CoH27 TaxID=2875763 RepID=UPI001CD709BD|nr:hypothetical protein [Streptomyces sp. CoH27]